MPHKLYHSGASAEIHVYVNNRGVELVADFIDDLPSQEQKKVVRLIKDFSERGEIKNREKFRLEERSIYAFKSFQVRILCFFLPNSPKKTVVLTHGLKKQKDRLPQSELEKAKRIYEELTGRKP